MSTQEVKGLRELGEALKSFGASLGKKYLSKAVFAAAAVIRDEAKSLAPVHTGNLRDHIAIFKRTPPDPSTVQYSVGVRPIRLSSKAKKVLRILRRAGTPLSIVGDPYYWRFLEFGTSKMAAHPFLRPAFESQKANAVETFSKTLAAGVEKAAQEARK